MARRGVYVEKGKGRTLSVNVRLWTNNIADGGEGYVDPGHAWFAGDVGFRSNKAHGISSTSNPIMFNSPDELVDAIRKAAVAQGVVLMDSDGAHRGQGR
ncbi:MAG: hypothetical protein E6G40_10550 [Actinobacteria bacterium]|nr:MAG: hypothetical protein E6G40_10550 [Actinomycetota bacterium]